MVDPTRFSFATADVSRAYDELLVPRLFEPWARLLISAIPLAQGQTVVDVATGPGTVARLAAACVGPRGRVIGVDLSQQMLAVADAKGTPAGAAPITYLRSPAAPLPIEDGVADVVFCQQGLQFFPDRPGALGEMRRVLRQGGQLAVAVWQRIEQTEVFAALQRACLDVGQPELAELVGAPFAWPDPVAIAEAVHRAGFEDVVTRTETLPLVYEDGIEQARQSVRGTPLWPHVAALPPMVVSALFDALARQLVPYRQGGAVSTSATSTIATARAP